MSAGLSPDQLAELRQFDSPTICNAVELWNLRPRNTGYMNPTIKACFPAFPPMVGYALTSTFRSMAPPRGGDVYGSIGAQLDAFADIPGPPVIVFQDLDEPCASATFGEVKQRSMQSAMSVFIGSPVSPPRRLTPRSRRGPTSKYQARKVGWRIFHSAGLAFRCRSRLNSNVRRHRHTFRAAQE